MKNTENNIPRRINMQEWTPAELAIYNAMQEVEKAGADVRLTDAIIHLQKAKDAVSDFVDGTANKAGGDGWNVDSEGNTQFWG